METINNFRGELAKGGEFGSEMLTIPTKIGPPPSILRKALEILRGRLKKDLRKA
jgi:hypothetical protein